MNIEHTDKTVLVVDDEDSIRLTYKIALKSICKVKEAATINDALSIIKKKNIDLVILDIMIENDDDGINLLRSIKEFDPNINVIMATGVEESETARQALSIGAIDYISKPFNIENLKQLISTTLHRMNSDKNDNIHVHKIEANNKLKDIITVNPQMKEVYEKARKVAASDSSVILYGESGCGKEIIARYIHQQSPRAKGPFIAINCGGIPENLLESELFGHEKGSFTGAISTKKGRMEMANGGTIMLDEIGTMPIHMQVKLLRVIQERQLERIGGEKQIPIDVRIISATNNDLNELIKIGLFREDLYFRLNVISFTIPPLRDRKQDIPLLLDYFIGTFAERFNQPQINIDKAVIDFLTKYSWPGNIRELENLVESFYALFGGNDITFSCLPARMYISEEAVTQLESEEEILPLKDALMIHEKKIIERALRRFHGNQTQTAKALDIHRNTLINKMAQLGIIN